jgi:hypothetical protein
LVNKNHLRQVGQIITSIANENGPNNLSPTSPIARQINSLNNGYFLPDELKKDALIVRMNDRRIFLEGQQQQQQQQQNNFDNNPPPPRQQPNQQANPEPQAQQNNNFTGGNQNTGGEQNFSSNQTYTSSPGGGDDHGDSNTSTDNGNNYPSSGASYGGNYGGNYSGASDSFSSPSSSSSGSEPSTAPTTPSPSRPSSPSISPEPSPKPTETIDEIIKQSKDILADDHVQPDQIQAVIEKLENLPDSSNQENKEQTTNDLNIKLIEKQQLDESKKTAERVITKLLQKNQIKISDLDIPVASSEELKIYLNKLETSQQVSQFVQQLQQQVSSLKAAAEAKRLSQSKITSSPEKDKSGQNLALIMIGGVAILGIAAAIMVVKGKGKK